MFESFQSGIAADIPWLWISARTFGIAAWLASSATVLVGLAISTKLFPRRVSPQTQVLIHRTVASLTLLLVLGHIASLIPDPYAKLSLLTTIIPGSAPINTFATALGSISFLVLLLVAAAGTARSHMPNALWKLVHGFAFVVWPLTSLHFILMGTDATSMWALGMIVAVAGMLVLLVLRRGYVSPRNPRRSSTVSAGGGQNPSSDPVTLTITKVIAESADAKTLCFTIADDQPTSFSYWPGQFLTLRIPSEITGSVARCYSLSSAPGVDGDLRVTVKRTPGGYASNWLCDNARPGMRLDSLRPAGKFTPNNDMTDLVLFAGGSGITPMISIVKAAMTQRRMRIALIYANRDPESIIFRDELLALARRHPDQLTVHHWLQSAMGIPTSADVADILASHRSAEIFICGPGPFMDLVSRTAVDFGWPESRVHVERFRSLEGDPFATRSPGASRTQAARGGSAVLLRTSVAHVELDGQSHVVDWPAESSLVDAMLDAGLDAPYSCLEGVCATCECTLVRGEVESDEGTHGEDNRVLGCQIRPLTEQVKVRY